MLINLEKICKETKLKPRGVIHIGAFEGSQIKRYNTMGIKNVIFIEANPTVYLRLKKNMEKFPHVKVLNYAISNNNDEQIFHVTTNERSSSLLPLKLHKTVYPTISEINTIKIPCRRLDDLLKSIDINLTDYDLLVMDIQGAELLALEGAIDTLKQIKGIILEVNFIELYKGCALFKDIDTFLKKQNFTHNYTKKVKNQSWGDSFFIRKQGNQ